MAIENGQVVLKVVTQGPSDPQCCPTAKVRKTYALQNGKLAEVGSEELGTVSLQDLNGTSWVLDSVAHDLIIDMLPALPGTEITAAFADGQVSGSAGCNSYSAPVSSDGGQNLTVSPIISTQMACSEPIMDKEIEYLTALQGVTQWSYVTGQLAMTYQTDAGGLGTLIFTPAPVEQAEATPAELKLDVVFL
jgi:heat shock protein HslJ